MFSFINEMFDFCINNIVGKPIISKCLFNIFKIITKIIREENISLALEISVFMMARW